MFPCFTSVGTGKWKSAAPVCTLRLTSLLYSSAMLDSRPPVYEIRQGVERVFCAMKLLRIIFYFPANITSTPGHLLFCTSAVKVDSKLPVFCHDGPQTQETLRGTMERHRISSSNPPEPNSIESANVMPYSVSESTVRH